ncbi:MAG: phosphoribosylamine--glycine ligase [Chitinispirillales bacterium]|jgi:phosphoribosylamine--glycine ligase|nr:phosphoribosylamine--glycine ligase [Chitinispirillales bacterium]
MDSVLIVGGGGREHALLKALLRTDRALCTFAYPGNPGMERDGCMLVDQEIKGWGDLADWAEANEVNLTVVGPEVPLAEGIVDIFKKRGLLVFGPSKAAARIEGSKVFAKKLMKKYGIPTAGFEVFTAKDKALAYIEGKGAPLVVKVDGLAAGKGAIVCDTLDEAKAALADIFDKKSFGAAGESVVIEEKMSGEEASVFVLADGKGYKILPVAQDHKRIGDGDTGPNTGGMGAYAPAGAVSAKMMTRVEEEIVVPTLAAMEKEKARYRGLLYVGLMMTKEGPKVVEYNCRFGDPEAQAVLPLVHCDWYEAFLECAKANGSVSGVEWSVEPGYCVSVVMASGGYPGKIAKGKAITGIDVAEGKDGVDVYFAGVSATGAKKEKHKTSGGRVLAVSAKGKTLAKAIASAYEGVAEIKFEGAQYRTDIGAKGVKR